MRAGARRKEKVLTVEEAHAILAEANRQVDWHNVGVVFNALGDLGLGWGKFNNAYFRANYKQFEKENKWLKNHWAEVQEALDTLRENK